MSIYQIMKLHIISDLSSSLTYNDPNNRKLRVLTIGAGVSGILMAYRLQKDCGNIEHVIYEKNEVGPALPASLVPPLSSLTNTFRISEAHGLRTGIRDVPATFHPMPIPINSP